MTERTSTIGVTGATGRLGSRVARLLAARGIPQRLVVRDPSRAPRLPGAQVTTAAYDDGPAARAALAGVDTLLMVSGAETPGRVQQHRTFIDAAVAAGVRRIVYTSFYGASPTFDLTGPEALTLGEVAQTLSAAAGSDGAAGRQVRYVDETLEEAYASRASYGAPDWQVAAWVSTYTAIAAGELAEVSADIEHLTGHAPTSLAELLRR